MKKKKINLLLYKIYIYFLISCCLVSTPNNTKNNIGRGDIISKYNVTIIDERYFTDPNIKIVDSYKIKDIKIMKEIINEIIEYNNTSNKYNWSRSEKAMLREWVVHNICYYLGIMTQNTDSVDFNNSEENFYSINLSKH